MIQGSVELLTGKRAVGWVCDPDDMSRKFTVRVFYDGQQIAQGVADMERDEFANPYVPDGCSFVLDFEEVADKTLLSVKFDMELPQGKQLLARSAATATEESKEKKAPVFWGQWPEIDDYPHKNAMYLSQVVGMNTGNMAPHHAIVQHIPDITEGGGWNNDPSDDGNQIAVFPCSTFLTRSCDLKPMEAVFRETPNKIVALGLDAQSDKGEIPAVPPATLQWVQDIIEHRPDPDYPNIALRTPYAKKVLEHYGFKDAGLVCGCPTLFLNKDRELGESIIKKARKIRRVAVVAGLFYWHHLQKIEESLARLVTETDGAYIAQSEVTMMMLARGDGKLIVPKVVENFRQYTLPELNTEQTLDWIDRHMRIFFSINAWMEYYRRFDFVIGTRFNGTMLAMQAGVPALCIARDDRTRELCEVTGLPHILPQDIPNGVTLDDLNRLFVLDPEIFDRNRQQLADRYVEFLKRNHIQPVEWLEKLA